MPNANSGLCQYSYSQEEQGVSYNADISNALRCSLVTTIDKSFWAFAGLAVSAANDESVAAAGTCNGEIEDACKSDDDSEDDEEEDHDNEEYEDEFDPKEYEEEDHDNEEYEDEFDAPFRRLFAQVVRSKARDVLLASTQRSTRTAARRRYADLGTMEDDIDAQTMLLLRSMSLMDWRFRVWDFWQQHMPMKMVSSIGIGLELAGRRSIF